MSITGVPVGQPPRIPPLAGYGAITGDTAGLAEIRHLVGGTGTAWWKTLINGMHLPGGWKIIEFVRLGPGSSCGAHLHAACEEFYYIISGEALMMVNGTETPVTAGDLITCPLGTTHGIAVPDTADGPMSFFVVEAFPGLHPPRRAPEIVHMTGQLGWCAGFRGGGPYQDTQIAVVDLARHLTGSLRHVTLIEMPAEDGPLDYQLPGQVCEVVFVLEGEAEITCGDVTVKGGSGLVFGTPLGGRVRISNLRGDGPLKVLSTEAAA